MDNEDDDTTQDESDIPLRDVKRRFPEAYDSWRRGCDDDDHDIVDDIFFIEGGRLGVDPSTPQDSWYWDSITGRWAQDSSEDEGE
jgi:hypothetical protein